MKTKKILGVIAVLMLVAVAFAGAASATDEKSVSSYEGFRDAVNNATSGDIIVITDSFVMKPGSAGMDLAKAMVPMTIKGASSDVTITIDNSDHNGILSFVEINTVKDKVNTGEGEVNTGEGEVKIENLKFEFIEKNKINHVYAVYVNGGKYNIDVMDCKFVGDDTSGNNTRERGLMISNGGASCKLNVSNCYFEQLAYGICFDNHAAEFNISKCVFKNIAYCGICFSRSNGNANISECVFDGVGLEGSSGEKASNIYLFNYDAKDNGVVYTIVNNTFKLHGGKYALNYENDLDNLTISANDNKVGYVESGTIVDPIKIYNGFTVTIPADKNVTVAAGKVLTVKGELVVKGKLTVEGQVKVEGEGKILVEGEGELIAEAIVTKGNKDIVFCGTLKDAIKEASEGDTVKMLKDVELSSTLIIEKGKNFILDLNGKVIGDGDTFAYADAVEGIFKYPMIIVKGTVKITDLSVVGGSDGVGTGKINADKASARAIIVYDGGNVMVEKVTIYGEYAAFYVVGSIICGSGNWIQNNDVEGARLEVLGGEVEGGTVGIGVQGRESVLVVSGGKVMCDDGIAISGNGAHDQGETNRWGTTITINGGTVSSANSLAIYHPQGSESGADSNHSGVKSYLYIKGGTITGKDVIGVKGGNVTISGNAVLHATGDYYVPEAAASSGINTVGDVIYVEGNYDAHNPVVEILGGMFTADKGKIAEIRFPKEENKPYISMKGGVYNKEPSSDTTVVDGNFIAAGYCKGLNKDGLWQVTPKVALSSESVSYGTSVSASLSAETLVKFYSSKSKFGKGDEWIDSSKSDFDAGTYYIYATYKRTGDNTLYETNRTELNVTKANQSAPGIEAVVNGGGIDVTVGNGSTVKEYEYAYAEEDDNITETANWISASGSTFTITGLKANVDYTVAVRAIANTNYNASGISQVHNNKLTEFSVKYNANSGIGSIESQTGYAGSYVTVKSSAGVSREGYHFVKWNTQADGNGTDYGPGTTNLTISVGATLYAQWEGNPYTVKFVANGGSGSMEDQNFTYGKTAKPLNENTFTNGDNKFSGWAISAKGPVLYTDKQEVQNLTPSGTITLYAKWAESISNVEGTISNASGTVEVVLKKGSEVFKSGNVTEYNSYYITGVPAGLYNLVATDTNGINKKTVTVAVKLPVSEPVNIAFPTVSVNSVVVVEKTNNTPSVVVVKLDEEAVKQAEADVNVTVTMTIESKKEEVLPETETSVEKKEVQKSIEKIKSLAEDVQPSAEIEYLDIKVEKIVDGADAIPVKETSSVITLAVPYDMTGKNPNGIEVYIYHDDVATKLTRSAGGEDGTFWVDEANQMITIRSSKYSVYAIGYVGTTPAPTQSSSSSTVTVFRGTAATYDGTILFDRSVVVTAAELPGASSASVTPVSTKDGGWYTFKLDADGFAGNGTVWFQVPLDVIAIKDMTEKDVSLFDCDTFYLSKDGRYAYYKASVAAAGTYTIGFEEGAAKTEGADTPVDPVVGPVVEPIAPVTPQPTATPAPFAAVLAGLGAAAVLLKRRQ